MSSISISFLMFELWLLRIFVFPGWILGPTFSVLRLKIALHFWELFLCKVANRSIVSKSHVWYAVVIVVAQVNSHSFFFILPEWNASSSNTFCRTELKSKLDSGSALFCSFLDLKRVTFFVCHHCGFLVAVQFLQEMDVIMFDTARKVVPN